MREIESNRQEDDKRLTTNVKLSVDRAVSDNCWPVIDTETGDDDNAMSRNGCVVHT